MKQLVHQILQKKNIWQINLNNGKFQIAYIIWSSKFLLYKYIFHHTRRMEESKVYMKQDVKKAYMIEVRVLDNQKHINDGGQDKR